MIIELETLTKIYAGMESGIRALDQFSFRFQSGYSYAITGKSGCGKTTLINLTGLLSKPSSGSVILNGQNADRLSEKQRAGLRNKFFGYVPQNSMVIADYSVKENIAIPLLYTEEKRTTKEKEALILEAARAAGIDDLLKKPAGKLSGGQKQRVAIARALVNDPEVILADEPTGSLDHKSGEDIMNLLLSLVRKDRTLIMVTHDQELAGRCDVILTMSDGKLITQQYNIAE